MRDLLFRALNIALGIAAISVLLSTTIASVCFFLWIVRHFPELCCS